MTDSGEYGVGRPWPHLLDFPRGSTVLAMDWSVFDGLGVLARAELQRVSGERRALLDRWNELLAGIGGDPGARDWNRFRPLRLSREEDWSDWLAHLMETSRGGRLARLLLGGAFPEGVDLGACMVTREERSQGGERRGDLVVVWESGACAHIEVKVGDKAFGKMFDAGQKLHEMHPAAAVWRNFLLLPAEDMDGWNEVKELEIDEDEGEPDDAVEELTWEDVAVALRRCLAAKDEEPAWKAWACAYTGAVEQRLLGHLATGCGAGEGQASELLHLCALANQIEVLKKGLDDAE